MCLSILHLLLSPDTAEQDTSSAVCIPLVWIFSHTISCERTASTFIPNCTKNNLTPSRSIVQPSCGMYSGVDTQGRSFFISWPLSCCVAKLHINELSWSNLQCVYTRLWAFFGKQNIACEINQTMVIWQETRQTSHKRQILRTDFILCVLLRLKIFMYI